MNKIILFLCLLILTSCFTERIELNLNEDNNTFVITGWITTLDEPQYVSLSRSVNYLGNQPNDKVSGADVQIFDGIETFTLTEGADGNYYMPAAWQARIGNTYELTVLFDGNEYTAAHIMRACPELENLSYQIFEDGDSELEDSIRFEALFSFQEIKGEGDAYYGVDYVKGSLAGDSLVNGSFIDDAFLDGLYLDDLALTHDDRLFQIGDTAVLELYSIGKETAQFLNDIELEIYRGGPFDPPPANIRTNIGGAKALGYFIVSDAKKAEIIIE